jgi:hypothetical protein
VIVFRELAHYPHVTLLSACGQASELAISLEMRAQMDDSP